MPWVCTRDDGPVDPSFSHRSSPLWARRAWIPRLRDKPPATSQRREASEHFTGIPYRFFKRFMNMARKYWDDLQCATSASFHFRSDKCQFNQPYGKSGKPSPWPCWSLCLLHVSLLALSPVSFEGDFSDTVVNGSDRVAEGSCKTIDPVTGLIELSESGSDEKEWRNGDR